MTRVARLVVSSDEEFWSSLIDGSFKRETDWRRASLILLHRNEIIFRGVTPSSDAILHTAGGGTISGVPLPHLKKKDNIIDYKEKVISPFWIKVSILIGKLQRTRHSPHATYSLVPL